jgi:hypothetical protein
MTLASRALRSRYTMFTLRATALSEFREAGSLNFAPFRALSQLSEVRGEWSSDGIGEGSR